MIENCYLGFFCSWLSYCDWSKGWIEVVVEITIGREAFLAMCGLCCSQRPVPVRTGVRWCLRMFTSCIDPREEEYPAFLGEGLSSASLDTSLPGLPDTFWAPPRPLPDDTNDEDGQQGSRLDFRENNAQVTGTTSDESIVSFSDDDNFCPTCLDDYIDENPKISTACSHHFHLGCIYEWMERSKTCPVCDKEMIFNEIA